MKKLFLVMTFILVSTIAFSQDKEDTTLVTNTNIERLADKYIGQATAAIKALAETLKQPAEFVYLTLIKQTVTEGYLMIWIPISIFVLCILTLFILTLGVRKFDWDKNICEFIGIATCVVGLIVFCTACIIIPKGILHINNPDYYVIKELFSLFQ